MDLQLSINEKNFPAIVANVSEYLKVLENTIKGRNSDTVSHTAEILFREAKQMMPEISLLRLDCLCLSLSKTYHARSGELFQLLEQLNLLVELLQGFMEDRTGSTTAEDMASLQKTIVKTQWQLTKVVYNSTLRY